MGVSPMICPQSVPLWVTAAAEPEAPVTGHWLEAQCHKGVPSVQNTSPSRKKRFTSAAAASGLSEAWQTLTI